MSQSANSRLERTLQPLSTQIVGSYSKPSWLIHKDRAFRFGEEPWRPEASVLDEARRDAARLAIYDQERAGLDVVTDGEAQRAAYDRYFYARLGGVEVAHLRRSCAEERGSGPKGDERESELAWIRNNLPRIVAPLTWPGPLSLDELKLLKRNASKPVKATVVGPLTSYDKMSDGFYNDPRSAVLALARVINQELRALDGAGADIIQLDEPRFHSNAPFAFEHGQEALDVVTEGVAAPIVVHVCYGYAYYRGEKRPSDSYAQVLAFLASHDRVAGLSIEYEQPGHGPDLLEACGDKHVLLGLLNLGTDQVETPDHIETRIREALEVVPAERLHPCADCGMWHLSRDVAFGKIVALAEAARRTRQRLSR